jgi:hypothetical protein
MSAFVITLAASPARADAARSVIVVVLNGTGSTLSLAGKSLSHGIWTPGWEPPPKIDNGATAQWRTESNGVLTGTEGEALYKIASSTGQVRFYWDNPFVGTNSYEASAPNGLSAAKSAGGQGNRTYVQFYIGLKGQSPPCNGSWIVSQLRTKPNDALTDFQKSSASFSTPFKEAGFSGWVTTGCSADGSGVLVRDPERSSDGFTTLDVELKGLNIGTATAPLGRFLRLECHGGAVVPENLVRGSEISFSGPVLIDMDLQEGGLLIFGTSGVTAGWPEVHPSTVRDITSQSRGSHGVSSPPK